jgi:penicillin G amidase
MTRRRRNEQRRRRNWRIGLGSVAILLAAGAGFVYWIFAGSLPMLEGHLRLTGLDGQVQIERDSAGVPTIRAANRTDLARALGFLHGQERFFQMDLLRRAGAGELSALVGARALEVDEARRRHRFRSRAEVILATMPPDQRALLDAYVAGVNEGLATLSRPPFEYSLLRVSPTPWQAADTLLVVYAMYFDLQESDGWSERRRALLDRALGPSLADFLYPNGNPHEAPIDGIMLPELPLPEPAPVKAPAAGAPVEPPAPIKGSNSFAVAGSLTATGAAIVANDEHLGIRMPNIWYRARLIQTGAEESGLDITGTTLPGLPFVIAGSNTHVAWGFTNSYIATGDAILLDPAPTNSDYYLTPQGQKMLQVVTDHICVAHADCRDLTIEETIWGPVVARDADGRRIVWHWLAQDANAIDFKGELALEHARDTREALDAAHLLALPDQNFVVGDQAGHIAWSIAGQVPRRIGLTDGLPHSWADGTHGWQGYLTPEEVPEIVDPPSGRLWTANNRIVGGDALARLGDAGYDQGDRARQIRDDLLAKDRFTEADLLAIQLDDRATALVPWQKLLLAALTARPDNARFAAMLPYVRDWGVRAEPDSVGYRLVRGYQNLAVTLLYTAYTASIAEQADKLPLIPHSSAWPTERLLTEHPANLVPGPYKSWDEFTAAVLDELALAVQDEAGGDLARFTWGRRNHTGIHHPLSGAVPLLGRLTDPPDIGMAGDGMMPRVVNPGFGASERLVVSPGHEAAGIYEMPGGQAGDPLSTYYLAGHEDWVEGKPSAFLPGPVQWRLILEPG